ncbi:hypothetical protein EGN72_02510 [Pseudorhodobacter sp. E13]|uniref:hypothetical protein n=1 Tax=Pseudorhodobacter sp. E13 TaxID=2487931 RepID=UPI000F8EAC2D|nr:hypothetical protein [Pseudorhodobacter sp. E13]RUS64883.1 hypothetical protein EGN72_02510 [Pseudorhodobacter sp. E13]
MGDYDLGMLGLVADQHWQNAGWLRRIAAILFGRHLSYVHLGFRFRVSFWRETPYLLTIREAR